MVFRRGDAPTPGACCEKYAKVTPAAFTVATSGCARPGRVVDSTASGASPAAGAVLRRAPGLYPFVCLVRSIPFASQDKPGAHFLAGYLAAAAGALNCLNPSREMT